MGGCTVRIGWDFVVFLLETLNQGSEKCYRGDGGIVIITLNGSFKSLC